MWKRKKEKEKKKKSGGKRKDVQRYTEEYRGIQRYTQRTKEKTIVVSGTKISIEGDDEN